MKLIHHRIPNRHRFSFERHGHTVGLRCPLLMKILVAVTFGVCCLRANVGDAQVVQLPAIRQFSYSGGVMVPDHGSAYLGGNRTSSTASSSRGIPVLGRLPGSVSRSSQSSAGGVSVSATMIDLNEMDRQILGYDPREARRARQKGSVVVSAAAEIAEAKSLVRNARRAVSEGDREAARTIYALAIQKLSRYDEAAGLVTYAQAEVAREFGTAILVGSVARRLRAPELDEAASSRRAESSVAGAQVRP